MNYYERCTEILQTRFSDIMAKTECVHEKLRVRPDSTSIRHNSVQSYVSNKFLGLLTNDYALCGLVNCELLSPKEGKLGLDRTRTFKIVNAEDNTVYFYAELLTKPCELTPLIHRADAVTEGTQITGFRFWDTEMHEYDPTLEILLDKMGIRYQFVLYWMENNAERAIKNLQFPSRYMLMHENHSAEEYASLSEQTAKEIMKIAEDLNQSIQQFYENNKK